MSLKTQGIVIRKNNSFNSDIYLSIFTEKYGKLDVISKRARVMKSPIASCSNLFVCGDFVFTTSTRGLIYTSSCDILSSNYGLVDNYDNLMLATYIMELINKTSINKDPDLATYYLVRTIISFLSADLFDRDLIRAYFNVNLSANLGLGSELSIDRASGGNDYKESEMSRDYRIGGELAKYARYLRHIEPNDMSKSKVNKETKKLMKNVADHYEAFILNSFDLKNLKSKAFIL